MAIESIAPFRHVDSFHQITPENSPSARVQPDKDSFSEALKKKPNQAPTQSTITSTTDLVNHLEDSSLRVKSEVVRSKQRPFTLTETSQLIPGSELQLQDFERPTITPRVAQFRRQKIARAYNVSETNTFRMRNYMWG